MKRSYFLKARTKLTKLDMAKIIVQALYNLPELPSEDDKEVKRLSRQSTEHLKESHRLAINILSKRVLA
jgi:hypothetical protein